MKVLPSKGKSEQPMGWRDGKQEWCRRLLALAGARTPAASRWAATAPLCPLCPAFPVSTGIPARRPLIDIRGLMEMVSLHCSFHITQVPQHHAARQNYFLGLITSAAFCHSHCQMGKQKCQKWSQALAWQRHRGLLVRSSPLPPSREPASLSEDQSNIRVWQGLQVRGKPPSPPLQATDQHRWQTPSAVPRAALLPGGCRSGRTHIPRSTPRSHHIPFCCSRPRRKVRVKWEALSDQSSRVFSYPTLDVSVHFWVWSAVHQNNIFNKISRKWDDNKTMIF